jgi:hypothetical protein
LIKSKNVIKIEETWERKNKEDLFPSLHWLFWLLKHSLKYKIFFSRLSISFHTNLFEILFIVLKNINLMDIHLYYYKVVLYMGHAYSYFFMSNH